MARRENHLKIQRKEIELIERVARNVRYIRIKMKKSQEELEDETGLNIPRCESGKHNLSVSTLSILSKYLNVEPYELLK